MPVDFRYHVISLIAVFCALAIGLLVGFSMVSSPQLEDQVKTLSDQVNETIHDLNARVQTQEQFINAATPWMLRERLANRRIAIIVARPGDATKEAAQALGTAIDEAGGQVNSVVYLERRFYRLNEERYRASRQALAEALGLDTSQPEAIPSLAAARLVRDLVYGQEVALADADRGRLLKRPPDSYTGPADSVVLIGGLADRDEAPLEMFDLPVIKECQRLGVRIVACELAEAKASAIPRYRQAKAATTVDDIDTSYGRTAVILALQSRERQGHFGIKDTAEGLLPPMTAPSALARQ